MATQVPVTLLNAGGGLSPRRVKKYLCKAFRAAVKDYCKKPKNKRGNFNNDFYSKLRGYKRQPFPWLAQNTLREVPVIAGNGVAGTAQALMSSPGPARQVAAAAQGAYNDFVTLTLGQTAPITGATAIAVGSSLGMWKLAQVVLPSGNAFWHEMGQLGAQLKYPDGLINNQIIEIKGPGDFFKDPTQRQVFNQVSSPNAAIVVNCRSCRAKCQNGPGSAMSAGYRRNKGCA